MGVSVPVLNACCYCPRACTGKGSKGKDKDVAAAGSPAPGSTADHLTLESLLTRIQTKDARKIFLKPVTEAVVRAGGGAASMSGA